MAQFKPNEPVTQSDPVVRVDVSRANPLPVGANRFRLVVVDDEGNLSEPVEFEVIVQAPRIPTAVLEMVDENGRRIDPPQVEAGRSFILSGAKSVDVAPGKVVEYRFTLLPQP